MEKSYAFSWFISFDSVVFVFVNSRIFRENENETNFALSYANWRFPHESTALFDFIVLFIVGDIAVSFFNFFCMTSAVPYQCHPKRTNCSKDHFQCWRDISFIASHKLHSTYKWSRQWVEDLILFDTTQAYYITFYYWLNSMCFAYNSGYLSSRHFYATQYSAWCLLHWIV